MSEVVTVESGRTGNVVRGVLATGLVATLAGGSFLLGDTPTGPNEDAAQIIADAYADGDAEHFIAQWDDRFTRQFEDRDRLAADITNLLAQGSSVEQERLLGVAGVPIVAVQTTDQITWCVLPDGTILPTCRLGEIDGEVDASALGVRAVSLGGGLDLQRAEFSFELRSTSPDAVVLPSGGELVGDTGPWSLASVTQVAAGQFTPPAADNSYTVGGGPFAVNVVLVGELVAGSYEPTVLTWRVGDQDVLIRIPGPEYWFR